MITFRCRVLLKSGSHAAGQGYTFTVTAETKAEANEKALRVVASKLLLQIEEFDQTKHASSEGSISGAIEPWKSKPEPLNVEIVDMSHAGECDAQNLDGTVGPQKFWVSWHHSHEKHGGFRLDLPWWRSGYSLDDQETLCAAVKATDDQQAMGVILNGYDVKPDDLVFRFCDERTDDWHPFNGRFPRADWMIWNDHAQPKNEK